MCFHRPARQTKLNPKYEDGHSSMLSVAKMESDIVDSTSVPAVSRRNREIAKSKRRYSGYFKKFFIFKSLLQVSLVVNNSTFSVLTIALINSYLYFYRPPKQIRPSVKYWDLESTDDENPKRPCERSNCPAVAPICFAGISERLKAKIFFFVLVATMTYPRLFRGAYLRRLKNDRRMGIHFHVYFKANLSKVWIVLGENSI